MAITVKNSMSGLGAIKKIGIPQSLFDWLMATSVEVQLTASQFKFMLYGQEIETVPVTLNDLQKLNEGTLPTATKLVLSQKLTSAIANLQVFPATADLTPPPVKTLDKLPPLPGVPTHPFGEDFVPPAPQPNPVAATVAWASFDLKKLKTAPVVLLREADQMYQPVGGTSGGSRYFVVAGADGIRVAARYTHKSLSIRVEGKKLTSYSSNLALAGLDLKKNAEYSSIHLEVSDDVLAAKTLGAILLGLGVPFETPFPNINLIKDA